MRRNETLVDPQGAFDVDVVTLWCPGEQGRDRWVEPHLERTHRVCCPDVVGSDDGLGSDRLGCASSRRAVRALDRIDERQVDGCGSEELDDHVAGRRLTHRAG